MKAIGRLYQYFDFKGIKPTRLERNMGLGNGYFSGQLRRDADIGSSIVEKIIENNQDLNIDWLITGKGNMIIVDNQVSSPTREVEETNQGRTAPPGCEMCKMKDVLISSLQQQIVTQSKLISRMEYAEEDKSPIEKEGQKRKVG